VLKVGTWNVNGIRAREAQLLEWLEREAPDVVCLQEIKATPEQVPASVCGLPRYWCHWHGGKGYSGVGLLLRRDRFSAEPSWLHPPFDLETRIVTVADGERVFGSVYVPNGGKDFAAKMTFLGELDRWSAALAADGRKLVLCGDFNVARTDMDVHPKERKAVVGQLPEERALIESILSHDLADVGREVDPANDQLFTWWAPWRNLRQRNIGWRLDYVLASEPIALRAAGCVVQAEVGTSDHAPVVATFAPEPPTT
jgi:exodeoxyribonuclease-3